MDAQKNDKYTIRTSAYNENPELMGLECKNCGGVLELVDKTHAICPYCGQKYLIDEAKGTVINVQVDYSGNEDMHRAVNSARNMLIIFGAIATILVIIILGFNFAAKKSVFSTSDSDIPVDAHGELLVIFFQDLFGKDYKEITPEELASIRYIRCEYTREGSENFNSIAYSFTNYEDCEDEEEFQDTVKRWTYRTKQVSWPSDYSMLTGLTRIDTTDAVWLSLLHFSPDNAITYVDTDDRLDTVSTVLKPEQLKVLHVGIMGVNLEDIGQFQNLEELEVDTNQGFNKTIDISGIENCKKLKTLKLRCGDGYTGVESIGRLSGLESLYIDHVELGTCKFLENLPNLKKLSIYTGTEPDLAILEKLPALKEVEFLDMEYIPAEELKKVHGLEGLKVSVKEPECLEILSGMDTLKTLNLHMSINEYGVPVDVTPLGELSGLEEIYLDNFWGGEITGLEPVLNLPGLKVFRLGKRMSSDMEPLLDTGVLQDNPSMEEVAFLNCFPKDKETGEALDYRFLTHYQGIKRLYLDGCDLTDISFVAEFSNLRACSLQDNEIRDLSAFSGLKRLEIISIDSDAAAGLRVSGDVEVNTESFVTIYE